MPDNGMISRRYHTDMSLKKEKEVTVTSGALMLLIAIMWPLVSIGGIVYTAVSAQGEPPIPLVVAVIVGFIAWIIMLPGFFIVEPNGSKVLVLFGSYKGTVKQSGFYWSNPFLTKKAVSLRARSLNGERLKVNDHDGNPVEIAAIVVWRVNDTYESMFEVDDYEQYVALQSETAVRHLAQSFPYDAEDESISLRRNTDDVCENLKAELSERLKLAGVEIIEARLAHLAYASEIAGAMLRRQQATAIIAARQKIVEGAVGMVEIAVRRLDEDATLKLDDERKAAMVSNLMVVLCSDHSVQPVVNTGTLYP